MAALPPGWKLPDLRIDVDGDWYDEGIQVTHPGILANLRGNLKKDAEGYFIQTRVRIPVRVDDAPFVLTRIERQGEGLHVVVNDGTEDTVDPATVRLGRGDVPYCAVKGGDFQARFSRAATFQLLALAEYDAATGRGPRPAGCRCSPGWPMSAVCTSSRRRAGTCCASCRAPAGAPSSATPRTAPATSRPRATRA